MNETPAKTLLVVDDNEENRDMLARRLERKGYAVLSAEDGQRALETIDQGVVDLVLLDIMMPGMTGIEVLRELRRTRSAAELPVIMVTAKTESEDIVEALEAGANDYVTKPIDFPVVLARLQAHLRTRTVARTDAAPSSSSPRSSGSPRAPGAIGPGAVIADRYRLETALGSGSFGWVYRSRHLELDKEFAVKILNTNAATDPDAVARFRREGILTCRVKHPHAVAVVDFGVTPQGIAYLVMELLEGRTLQDELALMNTLSPARCAQVLVPVCGALTAAHEANIIHRDIKPANIFLQKTLEGDVPKVLDFGIAKICGDAALSRNLTVEGSVLGTLAYMAPERFRPQPYDGKSDVYSVGVTLYQMLAGRLPFVAPSGDPMALAAMHRVEIPPPLRSLNPKTPDALELLVKRAMRKSAERRPSADEFARDLEQAVGSSGLPPHIKRAPAAGRVTPLLDLTAKTQPVQEALPEAGDAMRTEHDGPMTTSTEGEGEPEIVGTFELRADEQKPGPPGKE